MRRHETPPVTWMLATAILAVVALAAAPAWGQTTTATIRGTVTDASGAVPGVTVTAVNTETGYTQRAPTAASGLYILKVPPGSYEVVVETGAHEPWKKAVRAQVGATVDLDVALKPGEMTAEVAVVGTADPIPEMKTSEVATNVTSQQFQALPQTTRNFLNFAALAPGVQLSHDDLRQEYSYGAQGSRNTNVFIDGTSYKNDILQGGSVGQDSSRGNPFPQNAVQEFRVITQNFKAEYQKASSVIITAVTKSGGTEYHGDLFTYYQNKSLVAQDKFSAAAGLDKPEYTRWQPGVSIGGPIVKDKLHFFASYEGNYQDREYSVIRGGDSTWSSAFRDQFKKYEGNYKSPFRGTLFFGKLSFFLGEGSTLDVSGDYRNETDVRDFGNQDSFENANNIKNDVGTVRGKHTAILGNFLNEATVSYQQYKWNPTPELYGVVSQNYQGMMRIGGKDTQQNFTQDRFAIRDDVTLLSLQAAGDHVIKGGVGFDYLDYHVVKTLYGNPVFNYRSATYVNTQGDMPFNAQYGVGNPDISTVNRQFGVYLQDDWRPSSNLTVNVGVRWDFETDMLNNKYVTPANITAGLKSVYGPDYFTDGTQRDTWYGAIQPRIGLSYDLTGQGKTIVHAGYGKYYDRTLYNDILDEKYRLQYAITTFWFSKDGSPQDGNPAIKWDPSYLSKAALDRLIAQGIAPKPEIYLLNNNTRPPSSDQWSVGIRQVLGGFNASLAYTGVYSKNQMTWTCGIKTADGQCDWGARPDPNLGFSLLSRGKEGWFNSIQVSIEKPFTSSSRWSGFINYVWSDAKQTGNDLFSWGLADPVNGNKVRSGYAQEHQITASAIYQLPYQFRVSTLINLGSGYPFAGTNCSAGWDKCIDNPGVGDPPKWNQSIDFRLDKDFTFGGTYRVGVSAEVINVFNFTNEQGYDGWIPALPDVNTHYGVASSAYNPRRVQFGVNFGF